MEEREAEEYLAQQAADASSAPEDFNMPVTGEETA